MNTFIPSRPPLLTSPIQKPSEMQVLAYDKAFEEFKKLMHYYFIKMNNDYFAAYNKALHDALIGLCVWLSFACEGLLYV